MVASSITKAADNAGEPAEDGEDCGAPLPHERLQVTAAVAISPPRNIRPFGAFNAVAAAPLLLAKTVNAFGFQHRGDLGSCEKGDQRFAGVSLL